MKYTRLTVILLGLYSFLGVPAALAQTRNAFRAPVTLQGLSELNTKSVGFGKVNAHVSAYVVGDGRVNFSFHDGKYGVPGTFTDEYGVEWPDTTEVILLKGWAEKNGSVSRAAAAIINDELQISYIGERRTTGGQIYYKLTVPAAAGLSGQATARVRRTSHRFDFKGLCGSDQHSFLKAGFSSSGAVGKAANATSPDIEKATLKELTISLDGDSAWFSAHGSNSNATMEAYVNEVETIYENQLGITFKITRKNTYQSSLFGSADAANKLYSFQCFVSGEAPPDVGFTNPGCSRQSYYGQSDVYHLFTGIDLDGDTIGVAYVGVACLSNYYSFGLSQNTTSTITPITFAHELGHNFGANHTNGGIMNAAVTNPPAQEFSSQSLTEINSHLNQGGSSCLSSVDGGSPGATPTPTPTPTPSDPNDPNNPGTGNPADRPGISLTADIDSESFLNIVLQVSNHSGRECTSYLYASSKKNTCSSGTRLFATETTDSFSTRALVKRSRGKQYLCAVVACNGTDLTDAASAESSPISLSTGQANGGKLKPKKWRKRLKKALLNAN